MSRKKKTPDLDALRFETLLLGVENDVATVTLNRPGAMNTMNVVMREELGQCFERIRYDDRVRAVVITGAGRAFCAGGDANDFKGVAAEDLHDLMRHLSHRWFENLWRLPQPTVAAVNGTAAGGGANLALACDVVIGSTEARFGETFVRLGIIPDLGGLFLLPRIVGMQRAKQLCFSGKVIDAKEAAGMGLFSEVVPPEQLLQRARATAAEFTRWPAKTIAAMKAVLNRSFEHSMEETLQQELFVQSFLFSTSDHREALEAFFSKRAPRFK